MRKKQRLQKNLFAKLPQKNPTIHQSTTIPTETRQLAWTTITPMLEIRYADKKPKIVARLKYRYAFTTQMLFFVDTTFVLTKKPIKTFPPGFATTLCRYNKLNKERLKVKTCSLRSMRLKKPVSRIQIRNYCS